jgi:uncharacterized protein with FMN-binding domain
VVLFVENTSKEGWFVTPVERSLTLLATATLLVAFALPLFIARETGDLTYLESAMPEAVEFVKVGDVPPVYQAFGARDGRRALLGYVGLGSAAGYEGKIVTAVVADPEGVITGVRVVQHTEWATWFGKVQKAGFLEAFVGRQVNDRLALGEDLDAVASATFTSRGIAEGVRQTAHSIATSQLNLPVPPRERDLRLDAKTLSVLAIWLVAIAGAALKRNKLRWLTLVASAAVIGFWLAAPLSLASVSGLLLGRLPPFATAHLVWYLQMAGVVATVLMFGRNLYCYWVCPFGAVQELLAAAGGGSLVPGSRVGRVLRLARPLLVWGALIIVFVTRTPAAGSYEPFGTLFTFTGSNKAWVLLVFTLVLGLLRARFWCLYLCPVGYVVDLLAAWRRRAASFLARRRPLASGAAGATGPAESRRA